MEITHHEIAPGTVVIALSGKVMLGAESEQITTLVADLVKQGKRVVIFDLSGVTAIDSTGIGRFISSYRELSAVKGQMRLAGAAGILLRAFHVCRLDTIFPFFETVEQAANAS